MACNRFEDICFTIYADRPQLLLSAMARAYGHPALADLSRETRVTILSLIARVSRYRPGGTFYARRDRCAQEVGVSEKTVTRSISRFIEAGWLVEAGGGRTESGRFGAFGYQFTASFLDLVGLNDKTRNRETELSHGFLYKDVHLKEDHPEECADARTAKSEPPKAINPLPADVEELASTFSVHPLQVYRLMGIASRAGHRLADLLAIARDYLTKASIHGFRAVRYLEAMIEKGIGYAKRAAGKRETIADRQSREKLKRDLEDLQGQTFEAPSGALVQIRGEVAEVLKPDGSIETRAGSALAAVFEDVKFGILRKANTTWSAAMLARKNQKPAAATEEKRTMPKLIIGGRLVGLMGV